MMSNPCNSMLHVLGNKEWYIKETLGLPKSTSSIPLTAQELTK